MKTFDEISAEIDRLKREIDWLGREKRECCDNDRYKGLTIRQSDLRNKIATLEWVIKGA